MKTVLFRVDGGEKLGMGHLSRCLSLASMLKNSGVTPYFLIKKNPKAENLIHEKGFRFFTLQESKQEMSTILKLHRQIKFRCLIMDLRQNKSRLFFSKIGKICKTVAIGNNTHKSIFYADLVILPEIKEQYPRSISARESKKILIGTKYTLLGNLTIPGKTRRDNAILISMGGADKNNFTEKLVMAFKKTKVSFHVKIVIGRFFKNGEKISKMVESDRRFTIIKNAGTLIPFLMSSKIGILTMGVVTYEALFAGLPSLILSHSRENDLAARRLTYYDCFQYLGYHKTINFNKVPSLAFSLGNNQKLMQKYSENGHNLIDGNGIKRVTGKIIELIS